MGDVLAVGDAYQAQQGEMFIKECNSSGLINRTFYRQRGISGKSFFYWLRKIRSQMAEVTAPHLVQLEPLSRTEDVLQIQYRGAEMKLPAGVDLDAVAALLRSIESPMMNPRVRNYYIALWLYRSLPGNRRTGRCGNPAIWKSAERGKSVPVLRQTNITNQGVFCKGRFYPFTKYT